MWILTVLKFFGGLDIGGLVNSAVQAYSAKQDAGVKKETIDADLVAKSAQLSVQEAQLNEQIIIAEQGNWLTRMARPMIAFPFILYLWKVIIWDKVFALGTTDALGTSLDAIMGTIIASYFIGRTVEKTVSSLRNKVMS